MIMEGHPVGELDVESAFVTTLRPGKRRDEKMNKLLWETVRNDKEKESDSHLAPSWLGSVQFQL